MQLHCKYAIADKQGFTFSGFLYNLSSELIRTPGLLIFGFFFRFRSWYFDFFFDN